MCVCMCVRLYVCARVTMMADTVNTHRQLDTSSLRRGKRRKKEELDVGQRLENRPYELDR